MKTTGSLQIDLQLGNQRNTVKYSEFKRAASHFQEINPLFGINAGTTR